MKTAVKSAAKWLLEKAKDNPKLNPVPFPLFKSILEKQITWAREQRGFYLSFDELAEYVRAELLLTKKKTTIKWKHLFKGGIRMVYVDDVLALRIKEAYMFKETARQAQAEYEKRRRIIEEDMVKNDHRAYETDEFIVTRNSRITVRVNREQLEMEYPDAFANVTEVQEVNVLKITKR